MELRDEITTRMIELQRKIAEREDHYKTTYLPDDQEYCRTIRLEVQALFGLFVQYVVSKEPQTASISHAMRLLAKSSWRM